MLFNAKLAILQLYYGKNRCISMRWWFQLCT